MIGRKIQVNKQIRFFGGLLLLISTFSMAGCDLIRALIGDGPTNKCGSDQICCIVKTGPGDNSKVEQCVRNGEACLILGNTFQGQNGYPQVNTSDSTNVCVK
jgi:uncharacterized protein YgiM (DUF1202 family)